MSPPPAAEARVPSSLPVRTAPRPSLPLRVDPCLSTKGVVARVAV